MKKLPDWETRGNYEKSDFNRLFQEVMRLGRFSAEFPLEIINEAGGPLFRIVRQGFWAQLTSRDGDTYAWVEVQPNGTGGWDEVQGSRNSGAGANPAFEVNGIVVDPLPVVVWLTPGYESDMLFSFGGEGFGSSSSSSSESSESPSSVSCASGTANCISIVTDVTCEGDTLVVTKKYLRLPPGWCLPLDDNPCEESSSGGIIISVPSSGG
jgi:hypothetical protein